MIYPGPHDHYETNARAWCGCGEWCYLVSAGTPCACCQVAMAEANPCPCCDGTGVATPENVEEPT